MSRHGLPDPVEIVIAEGLERAGIEYERKSENRFPHLDFYLPRLNIYIEVKQFHTDRIADQMSRVPDIIAIQGMKAAVIFVKMISGYTQKKNRYKNPNYNDIVEWNCK